MNRQFLFRLFVVLPLALLAFPCMFLFFLLAEPADWVFEKTIGRML